MKQALGFLGVSLFFLAGCHSSSVNFSTGSESARGEVMTSVSRESASGWVDDIDIEVAQTAAPPVMGDTRTVDVEYTFDVKNGRTEPITIKRITIWGTGGSFQLETKSRPFETTIAPGETAKLPFWTRLAGVSQLTGSNAALTLRAQLEIEQGGETRKATWTRMVNGGVTIGAERTQ